MGKLIFTPIQKLIFDAFAESEELRNTFYFTGGTALSVFHFKHRYSDDLDFFSEKDFDDQMINNFIDKLTKRLDLKYKYTRVHDTRMYEFEKKGKLIIKVDFGFYPYKRLEKGLTFQRVSIDSLLDIGANKIMTINQRFSPKDFVDLYYILKKYNLWDLMYAVEKKFRRKMDVFLLSCDLWSVRELDFLPKMILPLKLNDLKDFLILKSKEVAVRVVE